MLELSMYVWGQREYECSVPTWFLWTRVWTLAFDVMIHIHCDYLLSLPWHLVPRREEDHLFALAVWANAERKGLFGWCCCFSVGLAQGVLDSWWQLPGPLSFNISLTLSSLLFPSCRFSSSSFSDSRFPFRFQFSCLSLSVLQSQFSVRPFFKSLISSFIFSTLFVPGFLGAVHHFSFQFLQSLVGKCFTCYSWIATPVFGYQCSQFFVSRFSFPVFELFISLLRFSHFFGFDFQVLCGVVRHFRFELC